MSVVLPSRPPLIGSLCSGYGGLDLGVQAVLGGTLAWHAEINPDASRILARHWPGVPNLGDITTTNWSIVPQVCVLTAGFPCQRRLGRRPEGRPQRQHPLGSVAARRPCGRGPPPLSGGDRECPGPPHLRRRFPWRRGILPVVSGRPNPASYASTWCRTRLPGQHRVRREMARASRRRRRGAPRAGPGLPCRLARRAHCSRRPRATSRRTGAPSTPRSARAAGTARTWRTRSSGCCRPRRRPTGSREVRGSAMGTATSRFPQQRPRCCRLRGRATPSLRDADRGRGGDRLRRRWFSRSGRTPNRKRRIRRPVGSVRARHRPMGDAHSPRTSTYRCCRSSPRRLRRVDAGSGAGLGDRHTRPGTARPAHCSR